MDTLVNDCVKRKTTPLRLGFLALAASGLVLSSCSHTEQGSADGDVTGIYDPFEESNRMTFAFNKAVDKNVIHPVITGYRAITPKPVRSGLRNFLRNLRSPVTFINQVLQGDFDGAGTVVVRTAINSTVGVGGIFDVAGHEGIEYEPEDFGQTLAVWGVDHGPYMVVPFIGPSSLRDYSGYFVDSLMDPLRWYLFNVDEEPLYYAKFGADYLDLRDSLMDVLKEIEASSIDYYASVRSTYYQQREALVNDQTSQFAPAIPDYDEGSGE